MRTARTQFLTATANCFDLNILHFNYLNMYLEGEGPPTFLPNVPRFDPLRIGEQCDFIITLGGDGTGTYIPHTHSLYLLYIYDTSLRACLERNPKIL
jgi:NAD kinase